jgi:hypothetical protein
VQPPAITGDIASDVQGTAVVFSAGSVAPNGGSFNPTLPQTVARPAAGQPAGSFSTTYTLPYGPEGLHCSVSKTFTKPVPPKNDACENYQAPAITGDIASDVQATQVVFSQGTVAPPGGTFNPTLPQTVARPAAGQPAGSFSTGYTLPYGPEGLHCSVSKTFTKPVPPREQQDPCVGVGEPTFSFTKSEGSSTATVTSVLTFPGGFSGSIALAPSPASGFPGGAVSSGASNNSTYNRPDWDDPALTVNGSWQVRKDQQVCRSGSASVTVAPKQRTCDSVHPNVSCSVTGDDASCSVSWNNPGSGSIRLDSVSYTSISNGSTKSYNNLSGGTHEVTLKVNDGQLECKDKDEFRIQAQTCDNAPATSGAAQGFSLPNSSPTTETAWVNANVSPGPYEFWTKHEDYNDDCTTAFFSAKVVLLKAGTKYWYFLNVTPGQQLCSGSGQDISHISKFRCDD